MRQQHQLRKITPQYQEYQHGDNEQMTEGGVEWEEFEIENIANSDDRTMVVHSSTSAVRNENGYKEESDKKKKKKSVIAIFI
jgi:myosin-15